MSSLKVRANQQLTMNINNPFKGFDVSFCVIPDSGNWSPKNTDEIIDMSQLYVTLRDKTKNINIFRMPYVNLFLFVNAFDLDQQANCLAPKFQASNVNIAQVGRTGSFPMNLSFGYTYDSDFELIVETKGMFKSGYQSASYVSFTPVWSTDPCIEFPLYQDMALSMLNIDANLGNSVNQVSLVPRLGSTTNTPSIPASTSDNNFNTFLLTNEGLNNQKQNYFTLVNRFAISSLEMNEQYDGVEIDTISGSFCDNEQFKIVGAWGKTGAAVVDLRPMAFTGLVRTLHFGEYLTNMRLSLEQNATNNDGMLVYSCIAKNADYRASQNKSDYIDKITNGNMQNL